MTSVGCESHTMGLFTGVGKPDTLFSFRLSETVRQVYYLK